MISYGGAAQTDAGQWATARRELRRGLWFVTVQGGLVLALSFLLAWLGPWLAMWERRPALYAWGMAPGEWCLVGMFTGICTALLAAFCLPGGSRTPAGRWRRYQEWSLAAATTLAPAFVLLFLSLGYGLRLTGAEFVYRPLFSLQERRYAYSDVRRIAFAAKDASGIHDTPPHLVLQFADGYRFSARRFLGTLNERDQAAIARFVSGRSGRPVESEAPQ